MASAADVTSSTRPESVPDGGQHDAMRHAERSSLPEPTTEDARRLAAELRITVTAAEVLRRRGIAEPADARKFLEPRLASLTDPAPMVGRAAAADRLAFAVNNGERICVLGDYDCDGITSAAIVTGVLRAVGGNVVTLLTSRFDGGYGVSTAAAERIASTDAGVLVTCDCGSSDHDVLAGLGGRGLDTIVMDHHLVPNEPLPVTAFLNPQQPACGFGYKGLASCGLAVVLGAAVREKLKRKLDLRPWLDLVALGTIADVAPLDGDNRALVRAGLERIRRADRPGVRALLEIARLRGAAIITGEDVAFRLAPRVNAPGRLGPPDPALELLLASSHEAAAAASVVIDRLSARRRGIQDRMIDEAVAEIEREDWASRPAIVLGREGWNHGVVGIVAGHLARRYDRPVVVVGFDGDLGLGSARGPTGARLHDALVDVSDCLVRYGGHQAAAGLTMHTHRLEEFRAGFEQACLRFEPAREQENDDGRTVWLDPEDDPHLVLSDFARIEPCGRLNPTPQVALEAFVDESREVKGGHLKMELRVSPRRRLTAFAPNLGHRAGELAGGTAVVVGKLRLNAWKGTGSVELVVGRLA